jgi:nucleoid-associated protein YgaU
MVAWFAGLLGVGALMVAAGRGTLAAPPLVAPSSWDEWAGSRPAPDAAVAVIRLVVLALVAYLLLASVVAVAVRLANAQRAMTITDLLTLPTVLRVVQTGLGVGFVGASIAAATAGNAQAPLAPTRADTALVSAADEPPLLRELPDHGRRSSTTSTTTTTTTAPSTPTEHPPAVVPPATPGPMTWIVRPGDHLWSIAERALHDALGRAPADTEIVPYWRSLIAHNVDRLADRDNPDLIFPGQTIVLPSGSPST